MSKKKQIEELQRRYYNQQLGNPSPTELQEVEEKRKQKIKDQERSLPRDSSTKRRLRQKAYRRYLETGNKKDLEESRY